MESVAPLLQTVLWVGLIGVLAWRFHKNIDALLGAIQKRIESGSRVKAGPFELDALQPQDAEQQKQKLDEELFEVKQEVSIGEQASSEGKLRSRILQTEDLALRAIQEEFGAPISRQVKIGTDLRADGAFTRNGHVYLVEVKYIERVYNASFIARTALRAVSTFKKYNFGNATLLLALVYHDDRVDIVTERERIAGDLASYINTIDLRIYKFTELSKKYGLD